METFVSDFSSQNIWVHLWRWFRYASQNIPTDQNLPFHFDKPVNSLSFLGKGIRPSPYKCFVSHRPTDPFFWKSQKKKFSESLVKRQVLHFTSTRSCLINTSCLKLSSILRFCSLLRHLVLLFLLYHLITNDRTT